MAGSVWWSKKPLYSWLGCEIEKEEGIRHTWIPARPHPPGLSEVLPLVLSLFPPFPNNANTWSFGGHWRAKACPERGMCCISRFFRCFHMLCYLVYWNSGTDDPLIRWVTDEESRKLTTCRSLSLCLLWAVLTLHTFPVLPHLRHCGFVTRCPSVARVN